ncbi:DNA-directed RNA polymerase subunit 2 [Powai lake megavirus]|uniref:DNA-directed RNA polymerase n=1 Tax=Powai lake megavirus TaxID=1842663 RepID=A0A167RA52_9VIRU|nr:DNA-directed RNA polymerase subunit 2 [Powai lake megavirus]ANB50462.1 DNA-directed RNA polymerase subunit 2 [Powai lake megavirus]
MSKKSKEVEDVDSKYDPEPFFGLLDLFFERSGQILVSHHIDSFNQLIEETIPSILQSGENIISEKTTENKVIRYRLTFDDLGIKPPSLDNDEGLLYPLDAIRKQLSYSSKYTATVTQWQDIVDISTGNTETRIIGAPEKDVPIAKIPIMVKSKYCNLTLRPDLSCRHCKYDAGGYFIINGSEKVVLSVESMIRRKPMVFTQKDQNSLIYYVRVLSQPPTQLVGNPQTFTIRMKKDNSIILSVPYFKDVSIFTLIRAMGIENDEDIVDAILDVRREKDLLNQLSISMNLQNSPSMTQEEAMEKMIDSLKSTKTYSESNPETRAKQRRKYVEKIMKQYILPHVSSGTNNPKIDMLYKAYYICYMIHKLLKCYTKNSKDVEEYRGCDDRDSMVNKRIMLTGTLLGSLFKQFYEKMINDCNKIFRTKNADDKKPPNIIPHIKANTIEQGLRQALSTGVFGTQSLKGLSQMLNRMNHLHSLSYLRRVITPTVDASTNKMTSPRHLHNTQYGSVDPLETPEGLAFRILGSSHIKNMASLQVRRQHIQIAGKTLKIEIILHILKKYSTN